MSTLLGKSNGMNAMDDNKSKALAAALAQIEKQFGKGSIMKMGEAQVQSDLSVVSTGSLGLDIALGVGGLPRGRVVEVYGPEASGKTTLCLQVVAQVQKAGGTAAYIDAENALDPVYAGKLGVNVGEMLISQPDTGEQGLEMADMLVRSGGIDIIDIDSVAALVPKAEIEGEIVELGVMHNIVEKSGAWYAYRGEKIGQGTDNTREYLREHPELAAEIEAKIRAPVGVPTAGVRGAAPAVE